MVEPSSGRMAIADRAAPFARTRRAAETESAANLPFNASAVRKRRGV